MVNIEKITDEELARILEEKSAKFREMTSEEKKEAIGIYRQYAEKGYSDTVDSWVKSDYEETPVDITTFLHDKRYLGNGLIDADGRFTLFPYWEETLKKMFPNAYETKYNTLILTGSIGTGKAQPMDSLVFTDHGFVRMGDIKVGDMVYGNDGKTHPVIGVFPQGERDIYRIYFSDRTSVKCSDEHLWKVYDKHSEYRERILTTSQLLTYKLKYHTKHTGENSKFLIPMTAPLEFSEVSHLITPYTLGCLIGDGCLTAVTPVLTSADNEILEKVSSSLVEGFTLHKMKTAKYEYSIRKVGHECIREDSHSNPIPTPNIYHKELQRLDLCKTACYKHIPQEYLFDSVSNRLELLRGLMDTDGWVSRDGQCFFDTISPTLRDDVVWLVESLGGTCQWKEKKRGYRKKDGTYVQCHNCFSLSVRLPKEMIPFHLSRKQDKVNKNRWNPWRAIDRIEYVGKEDCQCIYIDSEEHLYLTDHLIVTHNTMMSVVCMLYLLHRMLCLKDPYLYYGLQPIDKITFSLINVTIDAAKGVAWDKLQQLVQTSPWFMSHGKISGRSDIVWTPDKRIELVVGSNNNAVIGRALFCLAGDTRIVTDGGIYTMEDLIRKRINVFSYSDGKIERSEKCMVLHTIAVDSYRVLTLEDGTRITCTYNHEFLLSSGEYMMAEDIEAGTELMACTEDNQMTTMKVTGVEDASSAPEFVDFYDVYNVMPHHNFLVATDSGKRIMAHNCNFTDEVNFAAMTTDVDKIKNKMKRLIAQVDARMQSRFMKGDRLPTLQIIASSKASDQSFLDSYIDTKRKNESKTTLIIDEPQWVVRPDKDSSWHFYVAVGNKFLASEVLDKDSPPEVIENYRAKGYQMLEVPGGYYESFRDNVELALTDIAGISSTSALKYISGVRLNEIKTDSYRNPFTKDVIEVGTHDNLQYSQFFDLSAVPDTLKSKPLFVHLDMSTTGDKTGIAGVWIMGTRLGAGGDRQSKEAYYRVAFSVSVKAPKGYEISFEKNKTFIRWLREQGFNVKNVSMDSFQSASVRQSLEASGFNTSIVSVDRLENIQGTNSKVCLPYAFLKSSIYEKRLELYKKCDLLTNEIVGLEKESDGHINHPEGGTQGSKDQIDAVTGALWSASQSIEEYVYDYGEDYDTLLSVNRNTAEEEKERKKQLMIDFENEIRAMNDPLADQHNSDGDPNSEENAFVFNDILIW